MKTKILRITGIIVAVLAISIWAAPYVFQGKITDIIRTQISKDLRAHVKFSGTDISLFRNFPKITIGLENLTVGCVGEFQDDTMLAAKQFDIACNFKSLVTGHGIHIESIVVTEPKLHAVVHANGHANWNIFINDQVTGSAGTPVTWALQKYTIHQGRVDYWNEGKNLHMIVENLEQEGTGNFSADQFDLKSKTNADAVSLQSTGSIPYTLGAKASLNVTLHVDNKTHKYTFNTDQLVFNDLKLHTEGFFQWVNDSSYNMDIRYKVPSTDFKNLLSVLPAVNQKSYAGIEATGNANFNGFIRGKYDEKHAPAYHTNIYVMNGFLKYPDLQLPVEHINLGLQINNPDGVADHLSINISDAHVEINKDTMDLRLEIKNLKTRPFIDFALKGRLDLSNIQKCLKTDTASRLNGLIVADITAKGNIPGKEKLKKDKFQSDGDLQVTNFSVVSRDHRQTLSLESLLMSFTPDRVLVKELTVLYGTNAISATGVVNNLYDFVLRDKPLSANLDLKTDELNLRDMPLSVPANIDFAINAEAGKLHFDNLDLQNVSCQMQVAEQSVHFIYVRANGLDGEIVLDGTYSTLENADHPQIALNYDVKGLDIQKTFLAFNSIRRIMPVAKFMTGNVDAHMTLNGKMNPDMTTDLATLQGGGTVLLINGTVKDFGPMDKLSQSLDIAKLKNLPLKDVKADFTYKNGSVVVSPFTVMAKDLEFDIQGVHGFDQSLDYDVSLKIPRAELGKKGNRFVKNVVAKAAVKGIPVRIKDAVRMDVKMSGTINSPDVKADMDAVVSNAETDLKKEMDEFVNAKLDSARNDLHAAPAKKPVIVQTSYKPKTAVKHKKPVTVKHKKTAPAKIVKKKKKPTRNYTNSSKKGKSVASK